jgi:hypothetical protein
MESTASHYLAIFHRKWRMNESEMGPRKTNLVHGVKMLDMPSFVVVAFNVKNERKEGV